ncbi:MAG: metal ABC transporter permease [SAR324 cluster bacterium]|uniref:Metal ABC transporter permease n=1 Tax=SAR324 cluster bacterium TaxID=2024889 RepID=A0A2A4SQL8_9DELT|nr:MAG: metal ABC transporter permease [SAR324 cluster bacterium]
MITAEKQDRSHLLTLKTLGGYLWPAGRKELKWRVFLSLCCLAVAKLINVYIPFLYKAAVDALTAEQAVLALPLGVIIAYGVARVMNKSFGELRDFFFIRVAQNAQRSVALNTFKHLHGLSLRFHLDRQTGGLSRVIERGTHGIQFLLSFVLFNILPTALEILLVTGILFYQFNFWYALITFGTITVYITYTLYITEWRLKFRRKMNEEDSTANTHAIDSLLNYETVKYFGNENHEYDRYDACLRGYEDAAIKSQSSLSLLNIGQGLIIGVGLVWIMAMAANGVVQGIMTLGDFILVNTFLIQLFLPLNFLGFVYREIKRSLIDMDKMFELLSMNQEIQDAPSALPLKIKGAAIEFQGVSFGYTEQREILRNISFTVPPGKTVALVGPSGGGKSTLSRLLFRFYDVSSGKILIDGQDICEVTQSSLRAAIGIIPQDTVLFNDSIRYNIAYGQPDSGDQDIEKVVEYARLDELISRLPQGLETVVGERGLKLSGGEKQRVAIARTILKNPPILLFDEATSALDSHTEKEIQNSLKEVSRDRTTLVIAHRLSTIVEADQILVLKQGQIVEQGRHAELLVLQGEYAAMWARQQEAQLEKSELDL